MEVTKPKMVALLLSIAYCIAVIAKDPRSPQMLLSCGVLLFPLSLVWFPEAWGGMTGIGGGPGGTWRPTHPVFVAGAGWFFLVVMVLGGVAYIAGW